jgi:signal transduction histidine kinase
MSTMPQYLAANAGVKAPGDSARTQRPEEVGVLRDVLRTPESWVTRLLRMPLAGKIAGANALLVLVAVIAASFASSGSPVEERLVTIFALALAASLLADVALVWLALRPLDLLYQTTVRISEGDFSARVPASPLADPKLQRMGTSLNMLLDKLTSDRARMRTLALEVIRAGDKERAQIARELHDSTAQALAGVLLELSVAAKENQDAALRARLERVRSVTSNVLDEVKLLAHTVHPRVLDDLGLVAALKLLAREAEDRSAARVEVDAVGDVDHVAVASTRVLYRVAQEALNNALRHGKPKHVVLHVQAVNDEACLCVDDDGEGFSLADAERRRPGMGLFTMRERAALVGGTVRIESERKKGTRVTAVVPTAPDDAVPAGDEPSRLA